MSILYLGDAWNEDDCGTNKVRLKINGKPKNLPSGESIYIYMDNSLLKGQLYWNGKILRKNLDLKLVEVEMKKFGHFCGNNIGVVYDNLSETILIGKVCGLKGGSQTEAGKSIEEVFESLQHKIESNLNPFVSKDIEICLNSLIQSEFTIQDSIVLPEDLIFDLNAISLIFTQDTENRDLYIQKLNQLERLNLFGQLWDSFNIILELECFRRLSTATSRDIIIIIKSESKIKDILNLIEKYQVEEEIINEIGIKKKYIMDKYLNVLSDESDIEDWNFFSWINFIIEKKPAQKSGLLSLLENDTNFFRGKFLIIKDYVTKATLVNNFIESFNKSENSIDIQLNNQNSIKITEKSKELQLIIKGYTEIGLLSYIREKNPKKVDIISQHILEDEYKVKSEDHLTYEYKKTLKVILKSTTTKSIYVITIHCPIEPNSLIVFNSKIQYDGFKKFDRDFKAKYSLIKELKIDKIEADEHIKIIENTDPNLRKHEQYKIILKEKRKLRNFISNIPELKSHILDSFLANNCKKIEINHLKNFSIFRENKIEETLNKIVNIYKNELQIEKNSEKVLLRCALNANYESFINKEKALNHKSCIKLLMKSEEEAKKLKKKPLILLLGGTGSGKSTTACYLLKANLKETKSRFEENIVELKEKFPERFPKIGQSVGTSETLLTQGFEIKLGEDTYLLTDCPGFTDTRGAEYELCSKISINEAINKASMIKAVVFIIPYFSFLLERGNSALSEIENLSEILPDFIQDDSIINSFYILITKHPDDQNAESGLKARIDEYIQEISRNIEIINNNKSYFDHANIQYYKFRRRIWLKLQKIIDKKHLQFISVSDTRRRSNLLNLIRDSKGIDKNMFNSTYLSPENKKLFENCITTTTHTWTHFLCKSFKEELPKKIKVLEDSNNKNFENIAKIKNFISDSFKNFESSSNHIRSLEKKLEKITVIKKDPNFNGVFTIQEIKKKYDSFFKNQEMVITNQRSKVEYYQSMKVDADEKIIKFEEKLGELKRLKLNLDKEIKEYSTGSYDQELFNFKQLPHKDLIVNTASNEAIVNAINEIRNLDADEIIENKNCGKAKDYQGKLIHLVVLSEKYRIVPKNNLDEFFEHGNLMFSEGKSYKAAIEGKNFSVEYTPKSNSNGKNMVWPITTTWIGSAESMPWFKIIHTIPNIDRYEAAIINLNSEIASLNKEIPKIQGEIRKSKSISKNHTKRFNGMKDLLDKQIDKLDVMKRDIYSSELEKLLSSTNMEIKSLSENNRNILNNIKESEDDISSLDKDIIKNNQEIQDLQRELTYLALAIKDELKSMDFLYKTCTSLLRDQESNEYPKELHEIINKTLLVYIKFYENQAVGLKKDIEEKLQELNFNTLT